MQATLMFTIWNIMYIKIKGFIPNLYIFLYNLVDIVSVPNVPASKIGILCMHWPCTKYKPSHL